MSKKFMVLTSYLIASHLTASENGTKPAQVPSVYSITSDINRDRYQMQVVMDKEASYTQIYLLDKEKGVVWMTKNSYWVPEYSPWVKLPSLPIQE